MPHFNDGLSPIRNSQTGTQTITRLKPCSPSFSLIRFGVASSAPILALWGNPLSWMVRPTPLSAFCLPTSVSPTRRSLRNVYTPPSFPAQSTGHQKSPRVDVLCPAPPIPVNLGQRRVLVYELHITNFDTVPLTLKQVEVFGDDESKLALATLADASFSSLGLVFVSPRAIAPPTWIKFDPDVEHHACARQDDARCRPRTLAPSDGVLCAQQLDRRHSGSVRGVRRALGSPGARANFSRWHVAGRWRSGK